MVELNKDNVVDLSKDNVVEKVMGIISMEELMTNRKYRKMTLDELDDVLNYSVSFEDYCSLPGCLARGKAYNLLNFFQSGV